MVVHNNGKKHLQLLKCRAERQVCAERSIYVRGFCHTTSLENDLNDYFSKFGNVSSIFVDKEKVGCHLDNNSVYCSTGIVLK